ncbi:hypothetical protein TGFOU_363090 [Toxoplasma gondii FOU]|nr:hypothetical protein TGFOU_363090 [Toxoplasma gondii FOU]
MRGRPGLGYGGRGGRMFGGDDDRNAFMRRGGPEFWRDNGDRGDGEFGSNDPRSWGRGNDGMRPGGGPGGRSPYPEIMMPPMGVPGMPPPWGGVPPPSMMGGPAMSQPSGPDGSGPGGPGPNRSKLAELRNWRKFDIQHERSFARPPCTHFWASA